MPNPLSIRLKPLALAYVAVQRLYNRRITLRRDEADGGYWLLLETCLSQQDAAERAEEAAAKGTTAPVLRRGRILVTSLALSNEAMGGLFQLHQHHERCATKRKQERNRCQQLVVSRLAALKEAALNAELRSPVPPVAPVPPTAKPPRTPRANKGRSRSLIKS